MDNNYSQQRSNQLNSVLNAAPLDQAGYQDANNLLRVGQVDDMLNQQRAQEDANNYYYEQQQPWNNLNNYANVVGNVAGLGYQGQSSGTEVTTQSGGLLGSILGGAMSLGGSLIGGGGFGGIGGGSAPASMAASPGMLGTSNMVGGQNSAAGGLLNNPYANANTNMYG